MTFIIYTRLLVFCCCSKRVILSYPEIVKRNYNKVKHNKIISDRIRVKNFYIFMKILRNCEVSSSNIGSTLCPP